MADESRAVAHHRKLLAAIGWPDEAGIPPENQRHLPPMTDRELLELAIKRSGLSARAFARDVLWRDERTVRRWLSGESPVPNVVADRLREELRTK